MLVVGVGEHIKVGLLELVVLVLGVQVELLVEIIREILELLIGVVVEAVLPRQNFVSKQAATADQA
jgi:hypothetical protein